MSSLLAVAMAAIVALQAGGDATPTLSNADLQDEALDRDKNAASLPRDGAAMAAITSAHAEVVRAYREQRKASSRERAIRAALAVARKQPFVRAVRRQGGRFQLEFTFGWLSTIDLDRLEQRDPF